MAESNDCHLIVNDDGGRTYCHPHEQYCEELCPVLLAEVQAALVAIIPFLSIPEGMAYTVNPDTLINNDISFRQAARMCADAYARLRAAGG